MIVKKFQGATENDAILLAKDDLGPEAVVLNIKTMRQRGIFRMFKKDFVEITAAVEEKKESVEKPEFRLRENPAMDNGIEKVDAIEEKLDNLHNLLKHQLSAEKKEPDIVLEGIKEEKSEKEVLKPQAEEENKNDKYLELIKKVLTDNEVMLEYADQIISEVRGSLKKEANIDSILGAVYQKIVLKLGEPKPISLGEKTVVVFFAGPTGVGKTTTIAKIASTFKVKKSAKVALITSDTYRIAAVEQLNTYAKILGVPIKVVYTPKEMEDAIGEFSDFDLVLVDTAGRSHKNADQCNELLDLFKSISESETECDIIPVLVISATTKFRDIENIIKVHKELGDVRIIFTKLDETGCLGNILNTEMSSHIPLSYTTFGQNVPEDIRTLNAQSIAKQLLGGNE